MTKRYCMTAFGNKCNHLYWTVMGKGRYFFCRACQNEHGKNSNVLRLSVGDPAGDIEAPCFCKGFGVTYERSESDTHELTVIRNRMRQEYWKCGLIK